MCTKNKLLKHIYTYLNIIRKFRYWELIDASYLQQHILNVEFTHTLTCICNRSHTSPALLNYIATIAFLFRLHNMNRFYHVY